MIYDNQLNIITSTPTAQIPVEQLGVRYIELSQEQETRYNERPTDLNYILNGVDITASLDYKKQVKLKDLQTNYDNKISQGYSDATEGVTLRCDEYALTKFHKLSTQLDGTSKNTIPYWDILDIKHTGTKQEVKSLINRLGDYILELQEALNDKKTSIALAQNETELNNVNITF